MEWEDKNTLHYICPTPLTMAMAASDQGLSGWRYVMRHVDSVDLRQSYLDRITLFLCSLYATNDS